MEIDVAGYEVTDPCDPEQPGRVEEVGADDLARAERKDEQQRQAEEDARPDGCQPDDEPTEQPDENRRNLVARRQRRTGLAP